VLSYEVQPTNDQECAKRYAKYVFIIPAILVETSIQLLWFT